MRKPILTPEQEREYEAVKAEAEAMAATSTPSERLAMTRKLSIYAYGAQHLGSEERYIMSRWPVVRHQSPETGDEDDLIPL
jgi:hypothetical protein